MFDFLAFTKSLKLLRIHYSTLGDKVIRRKAKKNDKKIYEKKRNETPMLIRINPLSFAPSFTPPLLSH